MVAYTEREIHVFAALMIAAYDEYRLLYVTHDIISFTGEVGMAMEVPLGSHANARELFAMLEVIESSRFQDLPDEWSDRGSRELEYDPRRTERGGDFLYYDPWRRQNLDEQTATSRASATRVVPAELECGWVHEDEGTERIPRDASRDYVPYSYADVR